MHCIEMFNDQNLNTLRVVLGAHNINQEEKTKQTLEVKQIIRNTNYDRRRMMADIALIELKTPAMLTDRVVPPCMPRKGAYPEVGKKCVVAGTEQNV